MLCNSFINMVLNNDSRRSILMTSHNSGAKNNDWSVLKQHHLGKKVAYSAFNRQIIILQRPRHANWRRARGIVVRTRAATRGLTGAVQLFCESACGVLKTSIQLYLKQGRHDKGEPRTSVMSTGASHSAY